MPRNKLEQIIESFEIKEFSQFFRLKTRADGNFRPSEERLSQYEDADFFDFIKLGQIEFSETQRLMVVGTKVNKDLSERSGKKAQYEKAKRMLRELSVYSAGIFIFYDKDGNFRFSLIYPESVGIRREWSNFRRFTYFVSKELTNKTFLQRIGNGDFSTLEKIKDVFSVEKVTKEFYLEYRKLFDGLVENLLKNHAFLGEASKHGINTENFAKKLLGQIVFLYFIQKKGWLGVMVGGKWGDGDKTFMGNLYKDAISKGVNFYNDYLEKLFYNALNNSHRGSADPSFSKDFNSRIPFLNGGLFEAEYDWKNSLMYLDNKVFQAMFDVFERYNFTVEEESPDDKEIAVDPEMLGKVFENLLPENLRKGKGTYYTPREIVYYMCRESLMNYLVSNHSNITEENIRNYIFYSESFENFKKQKGESFTPGQWKELDDLLINIRVCDPACGSGAFLVGMLNMVVKLRIFLQTTPDSNQIPQKKEYELKRETIQNCIYGVDIDPGAIEIAKLRLWLALVVDYDLEDIEPLPNLDYRLMCGNSLLEEFEGVKFYNGENESQATLLPVEPEKQKKIEALKKKVKEYFSVHDDKDKLKKRKEINDIKDWLVRSALEKRQRDLTLQRKAEESKANVLDKKNREKYLAGWSDKFMAEGKIKEVLDNLHNPKKEKPFFIWKLEFVDVFEDKKGFDVIIANPPYVSAWSMEKENQHSREEIKNALKDYPMLSGHWDLYIAFVAKGHQLLKSDGVLSYIVPNPILREKYATETRKFLLENMTLGNILEFNDINVFEDVSRRTTVFLAQKRLSNNNYPISIFGNDQHGVIGLLNRASRDSWLKQPRHLFLIRGNDKEDKLINNIESQSEKMGNLFYVNYGAQVSSRIKGKFGKKTVVGTQKVKNGKEFYEGKDIKRWHLNWRGLWLDYRADDLYGPRAPELFAQNKIVIRKVSDKKHSISATLDTTKRYTDDGNILLVPYESLIRTSLRTEFEGYVQINKAPNLKYALAIILSKLESFYFRKRFATESLQGSTSHTYPASVRGLVIKNISDIEQKPFVEIVDKVLAITKSNDYLENRTKKEEVKEYERQINQMVYKLYDLTPEEIKIVENDK